MNTPVIISSAHPALPELPTRAPDKPRAWDMTSINPGHELALIFVRLLLISLIALGGWEVALWVTNENRRWPRNAGGRLILVVFSLVGYAVDGNWPLAR